MRSRSSDYPELFLIIDDDTVFCWMFVSSEGCKRQEIVIGSAMLDQTTVFQIVSMKFATLRNNSMSPQPRKPSHPIIAAAISAARIPMVALLAFRRE